MTGESGDACRLLTPEEYGKEFGPGRILFVRHGEKDGHTKDSDLTEAGRTASVEAGRYVERRPDVFLSSPSARVVHTVECMREGMGSDAPVKVLDCLLRLPAKDWDDWSGLKKANGRQGLLTMWMNGEVPDTVMPPFEDVARGFIGKILEAVPENGSAIAGTHNHQMMFIARAMGSELDGKIGYLDGIMFDIDGMRARLNRSIGAPKMPAGHL